MFGLKRRSKISTGIAAPIAVKILPVENTGEVLEVTSFLQCESNYTSLKIRAAEKDHFLSAWTGKFPMLPFAKKGDNVAFSVYEQDKNKLTAFRIQGLAMAPTKWQIDKCEGKLIEVRRYLRSGTSFTALWIQAKDGDDFVRAYTGSYPMLPFAKEGDEVTFSLANAEREGFSHFEIINRST